MPLSRAAATLVLASTTSFALADDPQFTVGGKFEVYGILGSVGNTTKGDERMSWGQFNLGFGPHWSATVSHWWCPYLDFSTLDETYLQYDDGKFRASYGRIRPPFGLNSWSDQWYYGFIYLPMVHGSFVFGKSGLALTQIGADTEYRSGDIELHLAATDTELTFDKLKPTNLSRLWGRVQLHRGDWIVGVDQTVDTREVSHEWQRRAVDFRWSQPNVQVRGELHEASDHVNHAWGYYADVFYRPEALPQITFLGRAETYETEAKASTLFTVGAKQRVSNGLQAMVNYVFGPSQLNVTRGRGMSFQLLYAFSF